MRRLLITVALTAGVCLAAWGLLRLRSTVLADRCSGHLHDISIALHNYHEIYSCFPTAYYTNDAGEGLHSWRLRVLPFLEQNTIYDAYRFDEPWNSPHNIGLGPSRPKKLPDHPGLGPPLSYFCPLEPELYERELTSYAMIVGPGTAFPVGQERSIDDLPDGPANTIVVAEIDHDRMHWMEPRDLHVEHMSFCINDPTQPSISSQHPQGPAVLFADGEVFRLSPNTPAALV